MKNVTTFERYIDNTESVSLFSQANLENSKKRGRADIFPRYITCGMCVGLLLISSSRYSRTCLLNGLRCHAFCIWNIIISFCGTGEEALKHYIMIYKITITHTRGWNGDKAEVGMNVEISSKQLSASFGRYINPFKIQDNRDMDAINKAFKDKYGIDLYKEGILNYSSDRYFKCEALG